MILFWQIIPYQSLNAFVSSIQSLILYKKIWILYITVLYIYKKILFKPLEAILYFLPALSIFQWIYLTLSITFILLLSIIRLYISLCNRVTSIKIRIISYILPIANIKKGDLNFVAKAITSLIIYLSQYPNRFPTSKDILYIAKTITGLLITYNKSEITQKSDLVTDFSNTKVA